MFRLYWRVLWLVFWSHVNAECTSGRQFGTRDKRKPNTFTVIYSRPYHFSKYLKLSIFLFNSSSSQSKTATVSTNHDRFPLSCAFISCSEKNGRYFPNVSLFLFLKTCLQFFFFKVTQDKTRKENQLYLYCIFFSFFVTCLYIVTFFASVVMLLWHLHNSSVIFFAWFFLVQYCCAILSF